MASPPGRSGHLAVFLLISGLCGLGSEGAAQSRGKWRFLEEDDGVKLWSLDVPGQEMPGFRGQTVMEGTPDVILEVLEDVDSHVQWMHRCEESRFVKRFSPHHAVVYNRTSAPWPVWDRDVVVEADATRSDDGSRILQTFHQVSEPKVALPERTVRMPRLEGQYELVLVSPGKTRVDYQVDADIGGSIPTWIAKRVARDMPFETLKQLEKRVKARLKP